MSTNNGLARFNPKAKTFRNYDVFDGLQSNEFNVLPRFIKARAQERCILVASTALTFMTPAG